MPPPLVFCEPFWNLSIPIHKNRSRQWVLKGLPEIQTQKMGGSQKVHIVKSYETLCNRVCMRRSEMKKKIAANNGLVSVAGNRRTRPNSVKRLHPSPTRTVLYHCRAGRKIPKRGSASREERSSEPSRNDWINVPTVSRSTLQERFAERSKNRSERGEKLLRSFQRCVATPQHLESCESW